MSATANGGVMRRKIQLDKEKLIAAIAREEDGPDPPKSRDELYHRVAARLDTVHGAVLGRIRDYGIPLKTAKAKGGKPATGKRKVYLDVSPFTDRGLTVTDLSDLVTSVDRSEEENKKIKEAWVEIRQQHGLITPGKKK
jgi:hypothetical protein